MKDNFQISDFFHIASKIIIILPVIIIITALILKFNQKENYSQKILPSPKPTLMSVPVITSVVRFDLNGPLVCQINQKQASVSAYVKDKKIFVTKNEKNKINYFLVRDDCLYIWEKEKYNGEKICGITPYLTYFEQFSKFGFLRMGSLDLTSFINNCRKEEIKDDKIFEVPKDVLFRNKN